MFVHPKDHVKGYEEMHVQPNALDIRADRIYEVNGWGIMNANGSKCTAGSVEIPHQSGTWVLAGRGYYLFESEFSVVVPEGYVGWLITRSSLIRSGVTVHSGLYDSGFKGIIGGSVVVHNPAGLVLEVRAPIAQFMMAQAEHTHLYDGEYNNYKL